MYPSQWAVEQASNSAEDSIHSSSQNSQNFKEIDCGLKYNFNNRGSHKSLNCLILLLFSEFVRNKLPYRLVPTIEGEDGMTNFLSGWADNKVRALVFQKNGPVRLRYLLTAFSYRDRVAFGSVLLIIKVVGNLSNFVNNYYCLFLKSSML